MIQILDDRTQSFIDFLNKNYGTDKIVKLSVVHGYDCLTPDGEEVGFAVYSPDMKMIILPTDVPEDIIALGDEEFTKNFVIHNLAHEYAHFLQDIGKLEGFDDENAIENVADDFADKAVTEFNNFYK